MSSNQEQIREFYNPAGEDGRLRRNRVGWLEFHCTCKQLDAYITPEASVVEFGCATGRYAEHWQGKCKNYLGVDIVQENVDFFNAKGMPNANAQLGDATSCPEFADNSLDVVLCLGPMYHLPAEERPLAMAQMARICKPGGVLAFAYINKMGVIFMAMAVGMMNHTLPFWKRRKQDFYPNRKGNDAVLAGVNDFGPPFSSPCRRKWRSLPRKAACMSLKTQGLMWSCPGIYRT